MDSENQNVKFKLFVSYASLDKVRFKPIMFALKQISNLEVFLYEDNKSPGTKVDENIHDEIEKCDSVLYFHSINSSNSQYVQNEIGYAVASKKQVFVVKLDESEIDGMLQGVNYIDFTNPDVYDREMKLLVDAINSEIIKKQQNEPSEETELEVVPVKIVGEVQEIFPVKVEPSSKALAVDSQYDSGDWKTVLAIIGAIALAYICFKESE